jgi:hypothetical protein
VTVVDRDPVEWPDGWESERDDDVYNNIVEAEMTKADIEHILATGQDMLDRWDELVGGES